jgi:two-component system response regulator AtoC
MRILIIDDDASLRAGLGEFIRALDHEVLEAAEGREGLSLAARFQPALIVLDQVLPGDSGLELLPRLRREHPAAQVVLLTGVPRVRDAVEAVQGGAVNYLEKPPDLEQLRRLIRDCQAQEELRAALREAERFQREILRVRHALPPDPLLERIHAQNAFPAEQSFGSVLIVGEAGTGKTLVARLLHLSSPRSQGPFLELYGRRSSPKQLELELFGCEGNPAWAGLLELAAGGTLVLDEIGEWAPSLQAKLLCVMQEGRFRRVGGGTLLKLDVRFIATSRRDLDREVEVGRFHPELLQRLGARRIEIPALRRRADDIPVLARHFLEEACREVGLAAPDIPATVLERLRCHAWPGNLRQLRGVMLQLAAEARALGRMDWKRLGALLRPRQTATFGSSWGGEASMDVLERQAIAAALQRCGGNRSAAARILGLSRKTLFNKMRRWEALGHPLP